ncbi:acyltransferase family protein [Pedobacter sp. GR22-6]|uniref:acyltransferase family protein n=1 Tax=Pedobacter sp. GR22-6 TaxID=3127957 RepID=UPI00307F627B
MTKPKQLTTQRNLPLDVLRGMTVALMITVNNPGSWSAIYAPFMHSEWHGFTLTDLVFPTFLFVVGNALSFGWQKASSTTAQAFFKKVLKRTAIIFLIGLLLNYFPFVEFEKSGMKFKDILELRIWGVLQRIAVCYLLANVMLYYLNKTGLIICSMIILLGYWAILYFLGSASDPYSLEGNFAGMLDLKLFDPQNLYSGFGIPFEPEGVLSTFPATINVIAGYAAGRFIQMGGSHKITAVKMSAAALLMLLIASAWNMAFPINKPIWSSSYALLSIGWDLLILACLIFFIDVLKFKKWTYFFEVFGKNPLFIYIVSWVVIDLLYLIPIADTTIASYVHKNFLLSWAAPKDASLLFALSYLLLMWLTGFLMDKNRIYVKV